MSSVSRFTLNLMLVLLFLAQGARAQDKDIPLPPGLGKNSDKWLIKIGMITNKKPPKLKFGDYATENRRGPGTTTEQTRLIGTGDGKTVELKFAFDLVRDRKDSVIVEASVDKSRDSLRDLSVYLATSIRPEDLWVLILREPSGANQMSLNDMMLTNGEEEIAIDYVLGEPQGKGEITAPKGLSLMLEGLTLGSMQYDSGGSFAYKKYIWIDRTADQHLQLLAAAVFSSILETAGYFENVTLVENP